LLYELYEGLQETQALVFYITNFVERIMRVKIKNIVIILVLMLNYIDLLTRNLYYGEYEKEEDKIDACKAALTLWETLIYDGNYQFFHCRIQKIYQALAMGYAKLQMSAETIDALKKAMYHAKRYDNLPKEELHYTSTFVNAATSDASGFTKNYTFTNADSVIRISKLKIFDFVRDRLDFDNT